MKDVTRLLSAIEDGDRQAADQLLPLVYRELRELAAAKLSKETPGQTMQATVLVHEAYLRLVDVDQPQQWKGRGHFFGAAAVAGAEDGEVAEVVLEGLTAAVGTDGDRCAQLIWAQR